MPIVFRWCVWGEKHSLTDMLRCSVATFKRAFGGEARYVVCTDEPSEIQSLLYGLADIVTQKGHEAGVYGLWNKWLPIARLDRSSTEFYVDADVFLVGDPTELRRFCADSSASRFIALQEATDSPYHIGRFGSRILRGIPPINAGLLGQRAGVDLTEELMAEVRWWSKNVPPNRRHLHDEQGAITAILSRQYHLGQVELLPRDRYLIVSPSSNRDVLTLDGIAAIHTTHQKHPGFDRFRAHILTYMSSTGHGDDASATAIRNATHERSTS